MVKGPAHYTRKQGSANQDIDNSGFSTHGQQ